MDVPDILINFDNDVHARIACKTESVGRELVDFFTFSVPNARFVPAFRHKVWDGKIRLYNMYNQMLYVGLLPHVLKFAHERGYSVTMNERFTNANKPHVQQPEVAKYIESLNIHSGTTKLTALPHQIEGVMHAINYPRCLLVSPTASGKSFIIYTLLRHYQQQIPQTKKLLVIVPTIGLVNQLKGDFADYSNQTTWDAEKNCHMIMEGGTKITDKPIVISTWQSIYKQPASYFSQFGGVVIDECFAANTEILTPSGYKPIQDFQPGDKVLNVDASNNIKVDEIIHTHVNLLNSHSEKMYRLEFDNGSSVEVTGNHKFLTKNRGWIRADQLTEEDDLECPESLDRINNSLIKSTDP